MPDIEVTLEDRTPAAPSFNDIRLADEFKIAINAEIANLNAKEGTKRNWIAVARTIYWISPPLEDMAGEREVLFIDVDGAATTAYVTEDMKGDITAITIGTGW